MGALRLATGKSAIGVFIAMLVAFAAWTRAAQAEAPSLIESINGTCVHTAGFQTKTGTPVGSDHPHVLVRYSASGPVNFNYDDDAVNTGDAVWDASPSLNTNDTPSVVVECSGSSSNVSFTASYYDEPTTPTSFAGAGEASVAASGSLLAFLVPHNAHYVADLTLSQGAVQLQTDQGSETFASSGTYPLGELLPGEGRLFVQPLDGPQAQWSIGVRALPVAISGLTFDASLAHGGTPLTARYTVDGDTTLNATILAPGGQPVRTIANGLALDAGEHSLTWDGRDGSGTIVPDGIYTLALNSTDPNGNPSSTSTSVRLDSTPPMVLMTSPTRLPPAQALTIVVSDAGSGLGEASLSVDGAQDLEDLGHGESTFSYLPSFGWTIGTHTAMVQAQDGLGNTTAVTVAFTVSSGPQGGAPSTGGSQPACDRSSAKTAVLHSTLARAALHAVRGHGSVFKIYGIGKLLCKDLTHDGKRDMTVLLECCTAASPTPLGIFVQRSGKWRLLYSSTRPLIYGLSVRGGSLIERRPVYRRSDALCCPSSYRHYRVRWSHGHFRVSRER